MLLGCYYFGMQQDVAALWRWGGRYVVSTTMAVMVANALCAALQAVYTNIVDGSHQGIIINGHLYQ